jgi:hypothetical protein
VFGARLSSKIATLLLFITVCWPGFCASQEEIPSGDDKIYVGILDDAREEMLDWKSGVADYRIVMPAFEKGGTGWATVRHFGPKRMKWTVAFDGKNLGTVETRERPDDETEADQINSEDSRAKQRILSFKCNGNSLEEPKPA